MKKLYAILFALFFVAGIVKAVPTITCDSVVQTSTCAGGNVIIPFKVTNGSFSFGTTFTAEMSNAFGQFTPPLSILGTTIFVVNGNGIIFGTIPANTNFGFFYRVRIVTNTPADTSSTSPNTIIVTQVAQLNTIISNPGDSACPGDTITLTALNPATAYSWSTGDTTATIQVTASGVYSVTTTDFLTCQSTAYDTVTFTAAACTGIAENDLQNGFDVYPVPSGDHVTLHYKSDMPVGVEVTLRNPLGQSVFEKKYDFSPGEEETIDVSQLAAGIYFLTLDNGKSMAAKKIVVQ